MGILRGNRKGTARILDGQYKGSITDYWCTACKVWGLVDVIYGLGFAGILSVCRSCGALPFETRLWFPG